MSQSASDYFKESLSELEELGRMIELNSKVLNAEKIGKIASEMNKKLRTQKEYNSKKIRAISKAKEEIRRLVEHKYVPFKKYSVFMDAIVTLTLTQADNEQFHS